MSKKPKFKPEITRVKLNPEQAVLTCDCHTWDLQSTYYPPGHTLTARTTCSGPGYPRGQVGFYWCPPFSFGGTISHTLTAFGSSIS